MNMPQNMPVDLNNATNVACDECEGEHFSPTFIIKQVSALLSPTGQITFVPIQVFKCDNCFHVNELFLEGLTN